MGQGDPGAVLLHRRSTGCGRSRNGRRRPISLRGRWAIDKPSLAAASGRSVAGPLAGLPGSAPVARELTLGFPLSGTPTDLAYDPATIAVPDDDAARASTWRTTALAKLNRHTIVDVGFSVDLGRFAGAAFLDKGQVLAVGENKSFVVLEPSDKADADANFRYFLESFDRFDEVARSRFGTVRARMMYVMSAAFDPAIEFDLHGDGAEQQGEAADRLALRPARHDAVGGVRADAVARTPA